ncbi:ABC-F family ATP-binding cassette domain-containing protein [Shouchella hunanensis]|uniref:ABC-F family ATP-binding cassette domain-containing protein n=1 Tax=Shouchella hunanensis TaxID=766894 RepID=A0ABY7W1D3_9BACI|nr:ABC-F family ATP-binding cassette domain-containing protein [Shouchella hunanensis]WDF02674.1 ABC-F family ATP-binding cassette domain-containing protein [Shouchella hunanensis]
MSLIRVEGLSKTFGEKALFHSIDFTIEAGDRIGLLGVNGTGKSTLLKVLAGVEGKEAGTLFRANDFTIEYLAQQPELPDNETVLHYIFKSESELLRTVARYEEGLAKLEQNPMDERLQSNLITLQAHMDKVDGWEASTQAKTILSKLGVFDLTAPLSTLSGGQKKRVAIARSLIQPVDLLLLDEPTNHLDHETVEWLEGHLHQYRGALVVITHDRYFLNRVATMIYELTNGNLYQYEGNFETYLEKRALREEQLEQAEAKRQNLLRREMAWLQRGAKARTTKQKARIQRVEALKNQQGLKSKEQLDVAIGSQRLGKQVIELKAVSKTLNGKALFTDLSYLLTNQERLGIIGANGSGKTTLLNIMATRLEPDSGACIVGETVKIGYYTQEDAELDGNLTVIDYIKQVAEVVYTAKGDQITAEQMLERFLFPRAQQWTFIRRLSGGEKRRLYLLRILMGEPNVLFLDEPTNDLDVETLAVLEDYIETFPGTVVTVSHDRYFLDRVVEQMLIFENGTVQRYQGDYTDYLEEKRTEVVPKKEKEPSVERKKVGKKLSYKEQREWDGIDEKIASLEEKQASLEEIIQEAGSDYGKIADTMKEKEVVDEELDQTLERWAELAEKVEQLK